VSTSASAWAWLILAEETAIPQRDPLVVYVIVGLMIAAVALGAVFASPLRHWLTGPDE
jgi:hypothetical protein